MIESIKSMMQARLAIITKLKEELPDDGEPGSDYELYCKYEQELDAIKQYLEDTTF